MLIPVFFLKVTIDVFSEYVVGGEFFDWLGRGRDHMQRASRQCECVCVFGDCPCVRKAYCRPGSDRWSGRACPWGWRGPRVVRPQAPEGGRTLRPLRCWRATPAEQQPPAGPKGKENCHPHIVCFSFTHLFSFLHYINSCPFAIHWSEEALYFFL